MVPQIAFLVLGSIESGKNEFAEKKLDATPDGGEKKKIRVWVEDHKDFFLFSFYPIIFKTAE